MLIEAQCSTDILLYWLRPHGILAPAPARPRSITDNDNAMQNKRPEDETAQNSLYFRLLFAHTDIMGILPRKARLGLEGDLIGGDNEACKGKTRSKGWGDGFLAAGPCLS